MKLVLKFDEVTRLYAEELDYSQIIAFIQREIHLESESITIAYTDPEGDQIVIGSNEDLAIMESLLEDKSYVKIHVAGNIKQHKDADRNLIQVKLQQNQVQIKLEQMPKRHSTSEEKKQLQKQQKKKKIQTQRKVTKKSLQKNQDQKNIQKKKLKIEKEQEENKKVVKKQKFDQNFENFNRLMCQTISSLVDERIRALMPCIREQAYSKQTKIAENGEQIVHEGYACLVCQIKPIVGVRYQCPKCPTVSLCQNCELSFDHQHNLIKIKKIVQQQDPTMVKAIIQLYNTFFKGKNGNKELKKEEIKEDKLQSEKVKNYSRQLKLTFGGKVADYTSIVQDNLEASLPKIVQQYCLKNNILQEQGLQTYKQKLFQRLRKRFTKVEPADLHAFIEENLQLQFKDIMKLYAQKIVKLAAEKKASKKIAKIQTQKLKKEKLQNKKVMTEKQQSSPEINAKKTSQTNGQKEIFNPRSLLEKDKGQIFDLMVEFYGEQRAAEFPAFINKYYKLSKEDIIQKWSDSMSKLDA